MMDDDFEASMDPPSVEDAIWDSIMELRDVIAKEAGGRHGGSSKE